MPIIFAGRDITGVTCDICGLLLWDVEFDPECPKTVSITVGKGIAFHVECARES